MVVQAGARYAEGLLKALGVQQALVVGHSAGALTAMELFKRCVHLLLLVAPCPAACLPHCPVGTVMWGLTVYESCCHGVLTGCMTVAKSMLVVIPYQHYHKTCWVLGAAFLRSASRVSVVHNIKSFAWYNCVTLLHYSMTE